MDPDLDECERCTVERLWPRGRMLGTDNALQTIAKQLSFGNEIIDYDGLLYAVDHPDHGAPLPITPARVRRLIAQRLIVRPPRDIRGWQLSEAGLRRLAFVALRG